MEERTDPHIGCSNRGGKVRKSTASPSSYDYKTTRLQQGTFCVKEPFLLPQGTLCLGYRHRWSWYGVALVQDRLDRVRRRLSRPPSLPRRHDWCRPCYQSPCKCREACRRALQLCKGRNPVQTIRTVPITRTADNPHTAIKKFRITASQARLIIFRPSHSLSMILP